MELVLICSTIMVFAAFFYLLGIWNKDHALKLLLFPLYLLFRKVFFEIDIVYGENITIN